MKNEKIILVVSIIISFITFWNLPFIKYFKLLVVLIHEICHASVALLTGNGVQQILVHHKESGQTIISEGRSFSFLLIVSAGYIGSTFLGGFLLWRGFERKYSKLTLFVLGIVLLFFTFYYSKGNSFTFTLGLEFGFIFITFSLFPKIVSSLSLIFIGSSISLYSIYDLSDFTTSLMNTDAGILANWLLGKKDFLMGFSKKQFAYLIAILWSILSLLGLFHILKKVFTDSDRFKHLNSLQKQFAESNVSPEVAKWFLERGLDLNGKPLSKNWAKEIKKEGKEF